MLGLKLFGLLALLQCVCARFMLVPKFYGQDSAVIVDTDKQLPHPTNTKLRNNVLYYNMPMYRLIRPESSSTTSTTPEPQTDEQYPSDLMHLARNKLGIKHLTELPSLSQLGELLGTSSASETIKYIRALTSNEQGIALMKAYLESLDYAQSETLDVPDQSVEGADDDDDNATDNAAIDTQYDELPKLATTTTTKAPLTQQDGSFMQRMGDFMKQYNLWSETDTTTNAPTVVFKPVFVAPAPPPAVVAAPLRPLHVRQPLPYHYPIPLRPVLLPPLKTTEITSTMPPKTTPTPTTRAPTHLNSPKRIASEFDVVSNAPVPPHVQHLAKMANISAQVLDRFLQQQPKLAELAKRVSRLPLAQQHSRAIDSQLFLAVQRALAQDEELKRLLNAEQTLK